MPQINVECVPVGTMPENCYIVENIRSGECIIVDPGDEAEKIAGRVGARRPVAVILTHGHYDHIGAVDALCSRYLIPLYMHQDDRAKLTDAQANVSSLFAEPMTVAAEPILLCGGEKLTLAGIEMDVLHTPGHSQGSVCYLLPEGQGILTGDTLFAHGYGRTDFADGSFQQMHASLRRLFQLKPKMMAYPGHNGPGLVGRDPVEEA